MFLIYLYDAEGKREMENLDMEEEGGKKKERKKRKIKPKHVKNRNCINLDSEDAL